MTHKKTFIVKCDDCKKTIKKNATFKQSVEGGRCPSCRKSKTRKLKRPVRERGKRRTIKLRKKTKRGRKLDRSKRSREAHELAYWGM